MFKSGLIPGGETTKIPDKKGTLEEAVDGVHNPISVAFEICGAPKVLPCPITNDEGVVMIDDVEDEDNGDMMNGDDEVQPP